MNLDYDIRIIVMYVTKKNIITIGDTKMNYQELAEVLTKTISKGFNL